MVTEEKPLRCVFAPEGITCQNCPHGPKKQPAFTGRYADCEIYNEYISTRVELQE